MGGNEIIDLENGVLTSSMDVNSREYKEFQLFLSGKVDAQGKKQRIGTELFALQIKIEDYLESTIESDGIITIGDFLRLYLDKLDIRQNKLAGYIGLRPSNFSKILSGSRKVNFELSFILSRIFQLDPKVWMLIQVKNDYLQLKMEKEEDFEKYRLEDLVGA